MRALSRGGRLAVTRVGARSLQVSFPDGFFPTAFSRFLRSPNERFWVVQQREPRGFSVVVESLDAQGEREQVLYEFPVPLDGAALRWVAWHDGGHAPWTPPRLGQTQIR